MTDIEAIVKSGVAGVGPFTGTLDGVSLWSNGHLMVAGEYPGTDYGDALPKLWVKIRDRADQPAETGGCILSEDKRYVFRQMRGESGFCWVNEAYRQALQVAGSVACIVDQKTAVAFRKDGALVGVLMPVNEYRDVSDLNRCEPTDELVWNFAASEGNEYYKLDRAALVKRLAAAEKDISEG